MNPIISGTCRSVGQSLAIASPAVELTHTLRVQWFQWLGRKSSKGLLASGMHFPRAGMHLGQHSLSRVKTRRADSALTHAVLAVVLCGVGLFFSPGTFAEESSALLKNPAFRGVVLSIARLNKAMREAAESPLDEQRRANVRHAMSLLPGAIVALAKEYRSLNLDPYEFPKVQAMLGGFVDVHAADNSTNSGDRRGVSRSGVAGGGSLGASPAGAGSAVASANATGNGPAASDPGTRASAPAIGSSTDNVPRTGRVALLQSLGDRRSAAVSDGEDIFKKPRKSEGRLAARAPRRRGTASRHGVTSLREESVPQPLLEETTVPRTAAASTDLGYFLGGNSGGGFTEFRARGARSASSYDDSLREGGHHRGDTQSP